MRTTTGGWRAITAASVLVTVAAPGPVVRAAEPAGGWTSPELVSSPAAAWANRPSVVVGATGRATAVWEDGAYVWAAHRPDGGSWQEPHRLGRGQIPQVDADARGRVTVIWYGRHSSVQTVDWRPRGGWTRAVTLSAPPVRPGVYGAGVPRLDVGDGGAVAVMYDFILGEHPDQQKQVRVAYRPPGGRWHTARVTGFGAHVEGIAITVDAEGDADLVYSRHGGLLAVRRPAGGTWGAPTRLADDRVGAYAAVGPDGSTVVAWSQHTDAGLQVYASRRGAAGWVDPTRISSEDVRSLVTDVAVDGTGRATVVYHVKHAVLAVDQAADGTWQSPTVVAQWTGAARIWERPTIAVDGAGDALTAWIRMVPAGDGTWDLFTEAAYRAGDAWGPAGRLTPDGDGRPGMVDAAVRPDGVGLLVEEHWTEDETGTSVRAHWFEPAL